MASEEKVKHEAYSVYPPTNLPVQIESLACYENNVLLGTRQGHLVMYAVEQNHDDGKMSLQLLQYDRNFSKKPVTQIDVVPEHQLLFSLTDGLISIHDIARHGFPAIHSKQSTKGATLFALKVDKLTSSTGEVAVIIWLCVVIKRQLQFWFWKNDRLDECFKSIQLDDVPKSVVWLDNALCIGFRTDYIMYFDISTDKIKKADLFPTSSSKTIDPCIAIVNEYFAVVKDEFLVAVDPKAPMLPDAASSNAQILKEATAVAATTGNKPFKSFAWSQPLLHLVWDEPYAIGLMPNGIEIRVLDAPGSMRDTFIQSMPELKNARHLARSKKGLLFAASVSQLYCIQMVDIQKQCKSLMKEKKFQLALQLTEISDGNIEEKAKEKDSIQTCYAIDLFANKCFKESMEEFIKLNTEPSDVIRLFPDLFPNDPISKQMNQAFLAKFDIPTLVGKDLELGLLALAEYLTVVRSNLIRQMRGQKTPNDKTLIDLSIIDTTLLKCYLQTNDSLVASVIRRNYCHLEQSEKILRQYQKYSELIILYETKGKHEKALRLLQTQAEDPSSSLYGHERTIQYLQNLGNAHRQLIFEFASYVIQHSPEDGLRIFTEDAPEVKNLHRAEVLDYLLKKHKRLVTPYLEHIIFVWKESGALYHNNLIHQYRVTYNDLQTDIKNNPNSSDVRQKGVASESVREKLREFLAKYNSLQPETVLKSFPENDLLEERAIVLGKLKRHEKVLAIYVQILGDIPKAIAYCEAVYKDDAEAAKTIFILLIRILLNPPTTPPYIGVNLHPKCLQPNLEAVLELLELHATKLDPHAVLQILPGDIPLIRLQPFLETALQHSLERRHNTQVLKGLLYSSNSQLQEQRMHLESKSVLVSDFSVCHVCSKKFPNQSALVRKPDGTIVHYLCRDQNYSN